MMMMNMTSGEQQFAQKPCFERIHTLYTKTELLHIYTDISYMQVRHKAGKMSPTLY